MGSMNLLFLVESIVWPFFVKHHKYLLNQQGARSLYLQHQSGPPNLQFLQNQPSAHFCV